MLHMRVWSYSYLQLCGYFWIHWVPFVMTDEFLVTVTKITSRISVSQTVSLWSSEHTLPSESFLESNPLDILALCKTNLYDSSDSCNFSERGYLPLIRKDSVTHVLGLADYNKEGLPFALDLSLENSLDPYLFSTNFNPFNVLLPFPLSITFRPS